MTCPDFNKVKLRTELDAKMALAKRINRDKGEIRYYKCRGHYHLTSQPLKTKAA